MDVEGREMKWAAVYRVFPRECGDCTVAGGSGFGLWGVAKDGGVWVKGLLKSCGGGGHVDVVRVVLDAGVDVDSVDTMGV